MEDEQDSLEKDPALRSRLQESIHQEFIIDLSKPHEEAELKMIDSHPIFARLGTRELRLVRKMRREEKKTN